MLAWELEHERVSPRRSDHRRQSAIMAAISVASTRTDGMTTYSTRVLTRQCPW
ncbi:hypothetical protein BX661DRAFT_33450 [Kickxella alabastrina]|uniref:uncharacterized protein n=1 Tax=Kickxella alabastrina TaxID=61397 RepID=UPI00221F4A81|nr:uncharacterized protein BX661DRAFT_33450 [Kickxella alabastrina]KAI7826413.1 hypothetical protein BX661DRAFT_33450 [Kickxella alabastrina]